MESYWKLSKSGMFSASHVLPFHKAGCHRNHGHNFKYTVEITSKKLDSNGMIIDFGCVKATMNEFDHFFINDKLKEVGETINPTAEELSRYFAESLVDGFEGRDELWEEIKVTLWETDDSKVEYSLKK